MDKEEENISVFETWILCFWQFFPYPHKYLKLSSQPYAIIFHLRRDMY